MLDSEVTLDDLKLYLRQHLAAQIATVISESDTRINISAPRDNGYYIGQWSKFTAYELPAVFIIPDVSRNIMNANVMDQWEHSVILDILLEGTTGEEDLTRAQARMAKAVCATLQEVDITPQATTTRDAQVFINSVDYGPMVSDDTGRRLRTDVFLTITIHHRGLLTPRG